MILITEFTVTHQVVVVGHRLCRTKCTYFNDAVTMPYLCLLLGTKKLCGWFIKTRTLIYKNMKYIYTFIQAIWISSAVCEGGHYNELLLF